MPTVLVVDDSPTDRMMASRFLQQDPEIQVRFAGDGNDALSQIRNELPDIVLTDLQMPECDGLQLVDQIVKEFPRLPVILMTAQGSEEIAAEALRIGAAGYVPKRVLAGQLRDIVTRTLSAAASDALQSRLMHSLTNSQLRFEIQNDVELIDTLAEHIQGMLRCLPLADESARLRVVLAVKHALLNGLYHGNLELPLDVESPRGDAVTSLIRERMMAEPYASRILVLESKISPYEASFLIRHEGPGFPLEPFYSDFFDTSSAKHFIRGIIQMRSAMDDVQLLDDGNTVQLTKRPMAGFDLVIED